MLPVKKSPPRGRVEMACGATPSAAMRHHQRRSITVPLLLLLLESASAFRVPAYRAVAIGPRLCHRSPAAASPPQLRHRSLPVIAAAAADGTPSPGSPSPAIVRWCAAGAALGLGLALFQATTLNVLRVAAFVWPVFSAVRLWKDGKRRSAVTVALMATARRFGARWWQYATIPLFAGAVGWFTNKVAVDMIFAPLEFWGIPLRRVPNQPLGWIGWQGIVPCKAGVMAGRLTDIVTKQLLDVREVFQRINPTRFSELLSPGVDRIAQTVVGEMLPEGRARGIGVAGATAALRGLPAEAQRELAELRIRYVRDIVGDVQRKCTELVDIDELMVSGLVREKRMLVDLFQRCGKSELSFLVNSGLSFGMALGVVQMLAWLVYERAWTLAAGGAIVGYLTNWVALKLIFEPVEPTRERKVGLLRTREGTSPEPAGGPGSDGHATSLLGPSDRHAACCTCDYVR